MKPLSNQAKALLRDYRSAESLGASARARLLDNLSVRIAAQDMPMDGLDVAPPEPAAQGLLAKLLAGPLSKIGLAVILAAIPSAWLLYSVNEQPRSLAGLPSGWHELAARPMPIQPESLPHEPAAPPQGAERVSIGSTAPGHQPVAHAPPPAPRVRRASRQETASNSELSTPDVMDPPPTPPPASGTVPADMIDEEVRLLSLAHAAIRAGRPRDALSKLREHGQSFPNSKLSEARQVARMIALCDSGKRAAARAEAQSFLSARPRSPFANRVRSICVAPGGKE
jgi:hypothetical protein